VTVLRAVLEWASKGIVAPGVELELCLRELAAEIERCRAWSQPSLSAIEAHELHELARSERISVTQKIALRSLLTWAGIPQTPPPAFTGPDADS
jgi:hypothetical protein